MIWGFVGVGQFLFSQPKTPHTHHANMDTVGFYHHLEISVLLVPVLSPLSYQVECLRNFPTTYFWLFCLGRGVVFAFYWCCITLSLISVYILRTSVTWDPCNVLPISKANFIKLDSNLYFMQNASVHTTITRWRRPETMRTHSLAKGIGKSLGFDVSTAVVEMLCLFL